VSRELCPSGRGCQEDCVQAPRGCAADAAGKASPFAAVRVTARGSGGRCGDGDANRLTDAACAGMLGPWQNRVGPIRSRARARRSTRTRSACRTPSSVGTRRSSMPVTWSRSSTRCCGAITWTGFRWPRPHGASGSVARRSTLATRRSGLRGWSVCFPAGPALRVHGRSRRRWPRFFVGGAVRIRSSATGNWPPRWPPGLVSRCTRGPCGGCWRKKNSRRTVPHKTTGAEDFLRPGDRLQEAYEASRARFLAGEAVAPPRPLVPLPRHRRGGVPGWRVVHAEVEPRAWSGEPDENRKRLNRVVAHLLFGSALRTSGGKRVGTCG
jgi:hypothetical protein